MMYLAEFSHFPSFSPFRAAKKQSLSGQIDLVSRCFDEAIRVRLKSLKPASISLSWLALAVDFLSFTHAEAKMLISNLRLSSLDDSLARYLDDSVKLLDLCNSLSSYIEKLRQQRLRVKFVCHLLEGSDQLPAPEKLRRARDSLSDWGSSSPEMKGRSSKGEMEVLIRDLAKGLANTPGGKTWTVGRLIRRTINAVVLVTVLVGEAVVRSLYGSPKLVSLQIPAEYSWAESFNDLETAISGELKQGLNLEEINQVEKRIKLVCDAIDQVTEGGVETKERRLNAAVKEVETATEAFSDGLERLGKGIKGMFDTVLCSRNVMSENFRETKPRK